MNRIAEFTESASNVTVESVDTAHPAWADVARSVAGDSLMLHEDGRLSARQTVLAALAGDVVVGHLAFRVEPAGGRAVRARLDSFGVDDAYTGTGVEKILADAADDYARARRFVFARAEVCAGC